MQYRVFLNVAPDGEIISSYRTLWKEGKAFPPGHPFSCDERDYWPELIDSAGRKLYLRDNMITRKPKVWLAANKMKARSGGEEIEVQVLGLPDEYERVKVMIGTQTVEISRDDPLEISWTRPAILSVQLAEKFLIADPIIVEFLE